jgi:hypothetical protein
LDSVSFLKRASVFANTQVSIALHFAGGDITDDVPQYMVIEVPYCSLQNFEYTENAGVFDANINFKAISPKGTTYNDPVTITIVNEDSSLYSAG